jgi:hypothetical protein
MPNAVLVDFPPPTIERLSQRLLSWKSHERRSIFEAEHLELRFLELFLSHAAKSSRRVLVLASTAYWYDGRAMTEQEIFVKDRHDAAENYRPPQVRILLVAETPPVEKPPDPPRYFYFTDVTKHDGLFRAVVKAILHVNPDRTLKADLLSGLRGEGVFLIDLKPYPLDRRPLHDFVSALIERCKALQPEKIILIKADVYDAAFAALRAAGCPVVEQRIPFPGSGHQREFTEAFERALHTVS